MSSGSPGAGSAKVDTYNNIVPTTEENETRNILNLVVKVVDNIDRNDTLYRTGAFCSAAQEYQVMSSLV